MRTPHDLAKAQFYFVRVPAVDAMTRFGVCTWPGDPEALYVLISGVVLREFSQVRRSIEPTTRYQPNRLPRLFGQQLADVHPLVPPTAGVFEVRLDWHHVLDTMHTPMKTPTQALTDRIKMLEAIPARVTIISFTVAGDRYDSAFAEIDTFWDQCRASGCSLGGGFYLVNEKTGCGGKAELISRLRRPRSLGASTNSKQFCLSCSTVNSDALSQQRRVRKTGLPGKWPHGFGSTISQSGLVAHQQPIGSNGFKKLKHFMFLHTPL